MATMAAPGRDSLLLEILPFIPEVVTWAMTEAIIPANITRVKQSFKKLFFINDKFSFTLLFYYYP
jgi:hypothetical protein